jgi:hypothetical protein
MITDARKLTITVIYRERYMQDILSHFLAYIFRLVRHTTGLYSVKPKPHFLSRHLTLVPVRWRHDVPT